jgi:CemA family
MKNPSFFQRLYSYLLTSGQWYLATPERSLDEAYKAALLIKAMEDEHFNGNKIAPNGNYGSSAMAYFDSELKKHLKTIRMRLTEFKASRAFFGSNQTITKLARNDGTTSTRDSFAIQTTNNSLFLEKLRFIDEVQAKYTEPEEIRAYIIPSPLPINALERQSLPKSTKPEESKADTTGVLPRSILNTINRIQAELDPNAEQEVIKGFRTSQKKTTQAVRFILLLVIVPLLTHQLTKNFFVGPIVDHFRIDNEVGIFLNAEMEERALVELHNFEEKLKFDNLFNAATGAPVLDEKKSEEEVTKRAKDIAEEFHDESSNAIKNIFADLLSVLAFAVLLMNSREEIRILKEFFDKVVYGLSDSAKAFIIILFTDIFVGFHSPHGWEVLLEQVSRHLGLPENHSFISLFIATFPVILDTIFKYWIFRYLNRISPSAVATYRNMND